MVFLTIRIKYRIFIPVLSKLVNKKVPVVALAHHWVSGFIKN
jgi:hypothetical protein